MNVEFVDGRFHRVFTYPNTNPYIMVKGPIIVNHVEKIFAIKVRYQYIFKYTLMRSRAGVNCLTKDFTHAMIYLYIKAPLKAKKVACVKCAERDL